MPAGVARARGRGKGRGKGSKGEQTVLSLGESRKKVKRREEKRRGKDCMFLGVSMLPEVAHFVHTPDLAPRHIGMPRTVAPPLAAEVTVACTRVR